MNNNPIQIIKTLLGKKQNAQQIAMQLIGQNNNPMLNNLITMAKNGKTQEIESIARNMFKEQGRDFDAELKDIQNLVNNFK